MTCGLLNRSYKHQRTVRMRQKKDGTGGYGSKTDGDRKDRDWMFSHTPSMNVLEDNFNWLNSGRTHA